jgi:hypothetical protein
MSELDAAALDALAGEPIRHLGDTEGVEAVTAEHVEQARQEAQQAELAAAESERKAVLGEVDHGQAVSDREAARFAKLRASLAERKAERHRQAERIRALDAAGQAAREHAGKLAEIKSATEADLAEIARLEAGIRDRFAGWNTELDDLIDQAEAHAPEKPRPGGVPAASSANVYASANPPTFITGHQILTPIGDHPDGPVSAVEAALRITRQHDPSVRLIRGESGVVVPIGHDPFGHPQRKIDKGELHELSLAEKQAYWRGEH